MDDNSIALFMSKPVSVDNIIWNSTSTANSVLWSASIADYITGSSVPNIWKNKLSGYNMFRGTAVLKVMTNGQPFQAGRLLIHFLPQASSFNAYSTTYVTNHNFSLCSKTQQPNVELDLLDGVATLEIPYIAPTMWHTRDADGFDWGDVYITVLSPLASAASTDVYINVFLYFKDFELAGPIYGPEMDVPLARKQRKERRRTKESGVVSSFFDAVAKPFDMLRMVPVIGSFSGVMSDASSTVSDLFSLFGWSRPIDVKAAQVVRTHNNYQSFNFNGVNTSDVLAMDSLNQVAPMSDYAGSNVDEMSFSYLKTIPAYFKTISWSTSATSGQSLYTQVMTFDKFCCSESVPSGTGTYKAYTAPPFVYLSRYFKYWRGGIVVTLKFVKTQFHSGRLAIEFTPSDQNYPTSASGSPYVYRDVIDVKESSSFSFTLPYIRPSPFLSTSWGASSSVDSVAIGVFTVRVLNPLVCSSTVSSTVEVLLYASAAEDFQLAGLTPVRTMTFQPEMNTDLPRISGNIADAPQPSLSIIPSSLCTGEMFLSVKQLLQCARSLSGEGVLAGSGGDKGCKLYPFCVPMPTPTPADGVSLKRIQLPWLVGDFISELAPGYVYSRGGVRYFLPETNGTGSMMSWTTFSDELLGAPSYFLSEIPASPAIYAANTAVPVEILSPLSVRPNRGGGLDVIFPHYGRTPFRLNYISSEKGSKKVPSTIDAPRGLLAVRYVGAFDSDPLMPSFCRAGADDYALGYFIGFPPFTDWSA